MNNDYMIYPKQFRSAKIPTEKNYCFFLMPFNDTFDEVYAVIKDYLLDEGFVCARADELSSSKPIINKILTEIMRAQYIIADLTDCNPNVFYELGITHTFKDSQNVLLLKQKESKVPFDITHLQYCEYRKNNQKQLVSIVKEFINSNRYLNDFYETLNVLGIINYISDNHEAFLDYLNNEFSGNLEMITNLLNDRSSELDKNSLYSLFEQYQRFLHNLINNDKQELLSGLFKLYAEMIIHCDNVLIAENNVSFFLNSFFSQHDISSTLIDNYKADFAISIAQKRKYMNIVLPWMIQYLSRSKAANIDLNRYKVEAYLMTSEFEETNNAITNAIFSNDCHIREHLADIIGEKRLYSAKEALCSQLQAEENFYTAVSIIEAIGKIGTINEIDSIFKWIDSHKDIIIQTQMYTVFRHAQIAISRLDKSENQKFKEKYLSKYGKFIADYIPL